MLAKKRKYHRSWPQETPWSGIYITSERHGIQQGTTLVLCWKYIWLRRQKALKSHTPQPKPGHLPERITQTSNTEHTLLWQGSSPQLRELITALCSAASIRLSRHYKEGEVQSAPVAPANNINITPCKQRIKTNFYPLYGPGLKRNILKLLERGHQGESNHSMIKKNVNVILLNRH